MKILMIGGTGNISLPASQALVARGDDVILYNRGNQPIAGARQVTGDRYDSAAFEQQMAELLAKEGSIDVVIDMICYHPEHGRAVQRALGGRIGQYIFCSTVDVYTKTKSGYPIREDFEREPNPAFEYAYHKAILEKELEAAARQGAFALTIFRPAATYNDSGTPIALPGPGLPLLKRMRQGKPVIVLGDGNGIWASTHRDDVAPAFVAAAGNPAAFGKAYNVCGEEWLTWKSYYAAAAQALGGPELEFVEIPAKVLVKLTKGEASWCEWNFQYNNIYDNTQAKTDLGYTYRLTWADGVARQVAYHDQRGAIDSAADYAPYEQAIVDWRRLITSL